MEGGEEEKQEVQANQPGYLDTLLKNAELQIEMNQIDIARENLEQIMAIDPDYPGVSELIKKIDEKNEENPQRGVTP